MCAHEQNYTYSWKQLRKCERKITGTHVIYWFIYAILTLYVHTLKTKRFLVLHTHWKNNDCGWHNTTIIQNNIEETKQTNYKNDWDRWLENVIWPGNNKYKMVINRFGKSEMETLREKTIKNNI